MFPKDEVGFRIDDQYYIGNSGLLIKPVTEKGRSEIAIYLAEDQVRHSLPFASMPLLNHFLRSTMAISEATRTTAQQKVDGSSSLQLSTRSLSSSVAGPLSQLANVAADPLVL